MHYTSRKQRISGAKRFLCSSRNQEDLQPIILWNMFAHPINVAHHTPHLSLSFFVYCRKETFSQKWLRICQKTKSQQFCGTPVWQPYYGLFHILILLLGQGLIISLLLFGMKYHRMLIKCGQCVKLKWCDVLEENIDIWNVHHYVGWR